MQELMKIGTVCKEFHVTSRTLRYYEEVGLLESHRHDNGYRSYDDVAITKLKQILFLKELRLSISEIEVILETKEASEVVAILNDKLSKVGEDIDSLDTLKRVLEFCIFIFKENDTSIEPIRYLEEKVSDMVSSEKGAKTLNDSLMEVQKLSEMKKPKLSKHEVRIVKLPPMRVASYRAESTQPETDAWDKMIAWKEKNGINKDNTKRQFGFDNPCPTEGNPVYGYEVWEVVDDDVVGSDGIEVKEFEGGVYAVATVTASDPYIDIPMRWQQLCEWVKDSEYSFVDAMGLEEHLPSVFGEENGFQLDLMIPIKK